MKKERKEFNKKDGMLRMKEKLDEDGMLELRVKRKEEDRDVEKREKLELRMQIKRKG